MPTAAFSGGGNTRAPSSDSSASVTPTTKKPSGSIANTSSCDASTAQSGASAAGATNPAAQAHSSGLRVKKAAARSRGRSPTVPNAAPMPKPIVKMPSVVTTTS